MSKIYAVTVFSAGAEPKVRFFRSESVESRDYALEMIESAILNGQAVSIDHGDLEDLDAKALESLHQDL